MPHATSGGFRCLQRRMLYNVYFDDYIQILLHVGVVIAS